MTTNTAIGIVFVFIRFRVIVISLSIVSIRVVGRYILIVSPSRKIATVGYSDLIVDLFINI